MCYTVQQKIHGLHQHKHNIEKNQNELQHKRNDLTSALSSAKSKHDDFITPFKWEIAKETHF